MATEMQQRAVEGTLENIGRDRPLPKGEILRQAGYSEAIAKNPDMVYESKGFKELLEEKLPDDTLLSALAEDIKGKPGKRKAELELAFKIKGHLKGDGPGGGDNNFFFINNEQARRIAERIAGGDDGNGTAPSPAPVG